MAGLYKLVLRRSQPVAQPQTDSGETESDCLSRDSPPLNELQQITGTWLPVYGAVLQRNTSGPVLDPIPLKLSQFRMIWKGIDPNRGHDTMQVCCTPSLAQAHGSWIGCRPKKNLQSVTFECLYDSLMGLMKMCSSPIFRLCLISNFFVTQKIYLWCMLHNGRWPAIWFSHFKSLS